MKSARLEPDFERQRPEAASASPALDSGLSVVAKDSVIAKTGDGGVTPGHEGIIMPTSADARVARLPDVPMPR